MTSSIACSMRRTPMPSVPARWRMTFASSTRVCGARPTAGSSRSNRGGRAAIVRTISTIRCSPPESRDARSSARPPSLMRLRRPRARSTAARSARRADRRPKTMETRLPPTSACSPASTFSSTVRWPHSPPFWNVRRTPLSAISCGRSLSSRSPFSSMRPVASGTRPVIALKSVVFPAPFGPITATTSPGATSRLTPDKALSPPKPTDTSRSASSLAGVANRGFSLTIISLGECGRDTLQKGHQPSGAEKEDDDHEAGDHKLLVARQVAQKLRRHGEHDGAEHRAGEARQPADQHDPEVQDEFEQIESFGRDLPDKDRIERTAGADDETAPREGENHVGRRGNGHRRGCKLVVANRSECPPCARTQKIGGRRHQQCDDRDKEIEFLLLIGEQPTKQNRPRHVQAHGPESPGIGIDVDPAHELAEREGQNRKIKGADAAQRRQTDQRAGEGAGDPSRRDGDEKRRLVMVEEDRGRVGADAEKSSVGKSELPKIADHDIEADTHQYVNEREIHDILRVVVGEKRKGEKAERHEPERSRVQTRPGSARPGNADALGHGRSP